MKLKRGILLTVLMIVALSIFGTTSHVQGRAIK